jgi:hypothetical protein
VPRKQYIGRRRGIRREQKVKRKARRRWIDGQIIPYFLSPTLILSVSLPKVPPEFPAPSLFSYVPTIK